MELNHKEIIIKIIDWLKEKKAENILYFDLKDKSDLTDSMIICHGTGELHTKAIAENVIQKSKEQKIHIFATEGLGNATWILIDFIDIIVHIFNEDTRNYYKLEELWNVNHHNKKDVEADYVKS